MGHPEQSQAPDLLRIAQEAAAQLAASRLDFLIREIREEGITSPGQVLQLQDQMTLYQQNLEDIRKALEIGAPLEGIDLKAKQSRKAHQAEIASMEE